MTTTGNDFISKVLCVDTLHDNCVNYVQENYTVDEIYDEDDIIEYVAEYVPVEKVYSENFLHEWAIANGYGRIEY